MDGNGKAHHGIRLKILKGQQIVNYPLDPEENNLQADNPSSKISWPGGSSSGTDVREELLKSGSPVIPVAVSKYVYYGIESSLHVTNDKLWGLVQKQNLIKSSIKKRSCPPETLNLSKIYDTLLEKQISGCSSSSREIQENKPNMVLEVKEDGRFIFRFTNRVVIAPPVSVSMLRLSDDLIERALQPAKRPDFSDPLYTAIASISVKKLDEKMKNHQNKIQIKDGGSISIEQRRNIEEKHYLTAISPPRSPVKLAANKIPRKTIEATQHTLKYKKSLDLHKGDLGMVGLKNSNEEIENRQNKIQIKDWGSISIEERRNIEDKHYVPAVSPPRSPVKLAANKIPRKTIEAPQHTLKYKKSLDLHKRDLGMVGLKNSKQEIENRQNKIQIKDGASISIEERRNIEDKHYVPAVSPPRSPVKLAANKIQRKTIEAPQHTLKYKKSFDLHKGDLGMDGLKNFNQEIENHQNKIQIKDWGSISIEERRNIEDKHYVPAVSPPRSPVKLAANKIPRKTIEAPQHTLKYKKSLDLHKGDLGMVGLKNSNQEIENHQNKIQIKDWASISMEERRNIDDEHYVPVAPPPRSPVKLAAFKIPRKTIEAPQHTLQYKKSLDLHKGDLGLVRLKNSNREIENRQNKIQIKDGASISMEERRNSDDEHYVPVAPQPRSPVKLAAFKIPRKTIEAPQHTLQYNKSLDLHKRDFDMVGLKNSIEKTNVSDKVRNGGDDDEDMDILQLCADEDDFLL